MGKGMELAGNPPEMDQMLDDMKDQLLLILVAKLGGKIKLTVYEIDSIPKGMLMTMELVNNDKVPPYFNLEVRKTN